MSEGFMRTLPLLVFGLPALALLFHLIRSDSSVGWKFMGDAEAGAPKTDTREDGGD